MCVCVCIISRYFIKVHVLSFFMLTFFQVFFVCKGPF